MPGNTTRCCFVALGFDASMKGLKKSVSQEYSSEDFTVFYTTEDYYLGDSGIILFDPDNKVMGVSSSVSDEGSSPFYGITIHTRVDAYSNRIASVTSL